MDACYEGRQVVGLDVHRRRSVLVRMTETGERLETTRVVNDPERLAAVMGRAGESPEVVLEATYGWYWAADTLAELGANVHLAHPLGVKAFSYRRVKNDERDAADLADLLRMGRLPEAWIAPPATRELRELVRPAGRVDPGPARRRQLHGLEQLGPLAERPGVAFAVEGCTGWRYVVEELQRAGVHAHVAEPAETAARRGPKRRAKTDRSDARLLRDLLLEDRIPESWIPPQPVLEARALVRLYKDLLEERTGWLQRVHATLFHMGAPDLGAKIMSAAGREQLQGAELSPATRTAVEVGMRQVDRLTEDMTRAREEIEWISRRQPACRALRAAHYGVGPLTSVAIWAEMGDTRRFRSSDDAVRHAGLDVTVHSSNGRRSAGHLARQGPVVLRWALYEAAVYSGRPSSPDYPYFRQVKARLDGQLALLSVARKLARRCHHTLRNLDDQVLAPAA